jgi:hypothetical protein
MPKQWQTDGTFEPAVRLNVSKRVGFQTIFRRSVTSETGIDSINSYFFWFLDIAILLEVVAKSMV